MPSIIDISDSYKFTHWKQYPPKTTNVYSYFESRVGSEWDETVFFGLQYILMKYFEGVVVHPNDICRVEKLIDVHMGPGLFNYKGWMHIIHDHDGKLPLSIKAVPEGTVVPINNVLMTVENTCDQCYWLTNFVETLLVQVWYPMTVATLSREMKKRILHSLVKTGDPSLIDFKLHDFGCRGVSSVESAIIGGMAHLVNFKGSDTVPAISAATQYYNAELPAAFSIPAAEHSTITSWGREHEVDAFRNMLKQFPTGMVAVVSDSYDIHFACSSIWGRALKTEVLDRDGTVIIRPDSGIPYEIVPQVFDALGKAFGYTVNNKQYKELPPQIAVIQGDGIDYAETGRILEALNRAGWSTNQLAFGMGGGLLQKLNRDTQRCAFKCSEITVDGETRAVSKSPASDMSKVSKAGRMQLIRSETGFTTVHKNEKYNDYDVLHEVFRNGTLYNQTTFDNVRKLAVVHPGPAAVD